MTVVLGVDTLSYHCRLDAGEVSIEAVLQEIRDIGYEFAQLNIYHVRDKSLAELDELRRYAGRVGLELDLAGEQIGYASKGESPDDALRRILHWTDRAVALGSPYLRVASGFYRHELSDPDLIRAEQRYVIESLSLAAKEIAGRGVKLLLENHSDFTVEEYAQIIDEVGPESLGVFLDVINPVTMLADPLPVVQRLVQWAPAGHVKDYRFQSRYVEGGFHRRGFEVQYCYPGEGVADLPALLGAVVAADRADPYHLSVEGLDNRRGLADQSERLAGSLTLLRRLTEAPG